ncbi:MAG: cation diffusion facilitator family transporter [Albidovulum sp.]
MPHDHSHGNSGHHHLDPEAGDRKVALAVAVNLALTVAQVAGGIVSGSVALIADAMHNLSDAVSLIIAFLARRIARRPATPEMSFGYGRAEVVAALVNYTTLIVISVWLGYEALARLIDPPEVTGWIVVALAGFALVIDLITAALTWRLAKDSMNIRAAFLHNLADAGTSVAVIVSGTLIMLYDWRLADPLITLGISVWILWHALSEIGPVIRILMLAAPPEIAAADIQRVIEDHAGVEGVHHLHLWQMDEKRTSLEAHLVLAEGAEATATVAEAKALIVQAFGITHATFEIETRASGCAGSACVG